MRIQAMDIAHPPGIAMPGIDDPRFDRAVILMCAHGEDHAMGLALNRPVEGLTAREVKEYIRYIADRRLVQLGLNALFHITSNPLPWLDEMLNAVEHANFFENRSTEYSKASTTGTWEEAFDAPQVLLGGVEAGA